MSPNVPNVPWPPYAAMAFGALLSVLTLIGVAPADATVVVQVAQYVAAAAILLGGLFAHLHIHVAHVRALASAAPSAPLIPSYDPPTRSPAATADTSAV